MQVNGCSVNTCIVVLTNGTYICVTRFGLTRIVFLLDSLRVTDMSRIYGKACAQE